MTQNLFTNSYFLLKTICQFTFKIQLILYVGTELSYVITKINFTVKNTNITS